MKPPKVVGKRLSLPHNFVGKKKVPNHQKLFRKKKKNVKKNSKKKMSNKKINWLKQTNSLRIMFKKNSTISVGLSFLSLKLYQKAQCLGLSGASIFTKHLPTWRIPDSYSKWLRTMVIVSPLRIGLWDPFQMVFLWLINGGDPNYLLTGMILQV